jgi:hypothetical protein
LPNILELDKGGHYKYKGTEADGDVASLVKKINKPETVCSMCPEQKSHSIDHFKKENVRVKNIN